MNLPTPSAWRYTHKDRGDNFISYSYSTEKPKMSDHPLYTPMFTQGQLNQYGQMCFDKGYHGVETINEMQGVADRFAHRLALELECVLADRNVNWDRAMNLIGEYRSAMNAIHEQHSPTFMGEPVIEGPTQ